MIVFASALVNKFDDKLGATMPNHTTFHLSIKDTNTGSEIMAEISQKKSFYWHSSEACQKRVMDCEAALEFDN